VTVRSDITTRADVIRLVDSFYTAVRADGMLGPIFDEVARVDWDIHLPKMYDFWETVLFGRSSFKGNPLTAHLALAGRTPLGAAEFDRWVTLFHAAVGGMFAGPIADEATLRATRIAAVMQHHIAAQLMMGAHSN
jgi:hemoglobin